MSKNSEALQFQTLLACVYFSIVFDYSVVMCPTERTNTLADLGKHASRAIFLDISLEMLLPFVYWESQTLVNQTECNTR
jgi:hypothetical protein